MPLGLGLIGSGFHFPAPSWSGVELGSWCNLFADFKATESGCWTWRAWETKIHPRQGGKGWLVCSHLVSEGAQGHSWWLSEGKCLMGSHGWFFFYQRIWKADSETWLTRSQVTQEFTFPPGAEDVITPTANTAEWKYPWYWRPLHNKCQSHE